MAVYPNYLGQIEDLVEQHLELVEEPLVLAIYFAPERSPDDVFLFEVLDNFRGGALDESGDILEVLYGSTEHFVMEPKNSMLHILLSSTDEFRNSVDRDTTRVAEMREAIRNDKWHLVYDNGNCKDVIEVIDGWRTLVHG